MLSKQEDITTLPLKKNIYIFTYYKKIMNLQIKRFLIYMINWIFIFKVSLNIMVFFLKKYIYLSIDESKFTKKNISTNHQLP
jgi:hypothetical protein